mgnify:CR=1 FL=1|jgi:hypothetical protein
MPATQPGTRCPQHWSPVTAERGMVAQQPADRLSPLARHLLFLLAGEVPPSGRSAEAALI